MPTSPNPLPLGAASRAEKMSVLSALLGPEALAKIREGQPAAAPIVQGAPVEVDADRAAWHRNKLLERLRSQSGRAPAASGHPQPYKPAATAPAPTRAAEMPALAGSMLASARRSGGLDTRLAAIADLNTFEQEHPAVIARLMKGLSREERVVALRSLPGPIARSIVRRLR